MSKIEAEITDEQAELVKEWVAANTKVPGWLDGYALGQCYIDSRANGGKGITERRRYLRLDQEVARKVPELAGQHAEAIKEYLQEREESLTAGPRL